MINVLAIYIADLLHLFGLLCCSSFRINFYFIVGLVLYLSFEDGLKLVKLRGEAMQVTFLVVYYASSARPSWFMIHVCERDRL